jgi:hypothetical protein
MLRAYDQSDPQKTEHLPQKESIIQYFTERLEVSTQFPLMNVYNASYVSIYMYL